MKYNFRSLLLKVVFFLTIGVPELGQSQELMRALKPFKSLTDQGIESVVVVSVASNYDEGLKITFHVVLAEYNSGARFNKIDDKIDNFDIEGMQVIAATASDPREIIFREVMNVDLDMGREGVFSCSGCGSIFIPWDLAKRSDEISFSMLGGNMLFLYDGPNLK